MLLGAMLNCQLAFRFAVYHILHWPIRALVASARSLQRCYVVRGIGRAWAASRAQRGSAPHGIEFGRHWQANLSDLACHCCEVADVLCFRTKRMYNVNRFAHLRGGVLATARVGM